MESVLPRTWLSVFCLAFVALVASAWSLDAQAVDNAERARTASDTIRAIEIVRRDIFDPEEAKKSWIARIVNGLHVTTRPSVVRKELLFRAGELYDSARIAETERNLRSLGIFRRVLIDTVRTDSGLVARVNTKDGWSTRTDFRFRSSGDEIAFTIRVAERNLLGTASTAAFEFRDDPDRSTIALEFQRSRLIANAVGLGLLYEDRSDGTVFSAAIGRPFLSLASRLSYGVSGTVRDARVLRFRDGIRGTASETLRQRRTSARLAGAWALRSGDEGYLRIGGIGEVRREDFRDDSLTGAFPETVTGVIGPFFQWSRSRFLVTRGFLGFGREEDVNLSTTVQLSALVAPRAFGYERDGIGPGINVRSGTTFPLGFALIEAAANGLFTGAGLDSGAVILGGTAVLQPAQGHRAMFHVEAGWLENPTPGAEFDLGLDVGPRAFSSHAFTGDRMVFATAEYRYTVMPNLWGLAGFGVAAFVDHGGAWYDGFERRLGWDAGVGLRIGLSRATNPSPLRVDLARRFATDVESAGWVVVIAKGLAFSLFPSLTR
jgi:hypothetical protein